MGGKKSDGQDKDVTSQGKEIERTKGVGSHMGIRKHFEGRKKEKRKRKRNTEMQGRNKT